MIDGDEAGITRQRVLKRPLLWVARACLLFVILVPLTVWGYSVLLLRIVLEAIVQRILNPLLKHAKDSLLEVNRLIEDWL